MVSTAAAEEELTSGRRSAAPRPARQQRDLLGRREKFRRSKSRERSLERRWADPCGPCPCCEEAGSEEEAWTPPHWHGHHGPPCRHRYSYSGPPDCWPPPCPPLDYHRWLAPYKVGRLTGTGTGTVCPDRR